MSQTPVFETSTESAVDKWGGEASVTVVTMDGLPVFSFVTTRRGQNGFEHVVQGVSVETKGQYGLNNRERFNGCPTTMAETFIGEPSAEEVLQRRLGSIAWERGASFLRSAEKGTEIPTDEHPEFYKGIAAMKSRYGRRTRNGRVIGEPARW